MNDHRGFTLIEAIVGILILGVATWFLISSFGLFVHRKSLARSKTAIWQIEEGVRREVLSTLSQIFRDMSGSSCVLPQPLKARLESIAIPGTRLTVVGDQDRNRMLASLKHPERAGNFQTALQRCQQSQAANLSVEFFQEKAQLYFCLSITESDETSAVAGRSIRSLSPVFAEFLYTNINLALGTPLTCPDFAQTLASSPQIPSAGVLYYTFYWSGGGAIAEALTHQSGALLIGNI